MGRENLALLGAVLESTETNKVGTYLIVTPPDVKWKIDGKGVYRGTIQVLKTAATNGNVINGSGSGVINPSGDDDWNMENAGNFIRQNDESEEITISGIIPPGTPGTFTMKVKIKNSGQSVWDVA